MPTPAEVINDPECPCRDLPGHVCRDKFGDLWSRPGIGPRAGSHCHNGFRVNLDIVGVVARKHSARPRRGFVFAAADAARLSPAGTRHVPDPHTPTAEEAAYEQWLDSFNDEIGPEENGTVR